jgi:4-amino-4-deoxy-L-arabinose transferase-like glycosyltransferase
MTEKELCFTRFKAKGENFLGRFFTSDWTVSVILFLLAFIIRIPYLYDVPRFIDEWREIGLSAQIARGEVWPLHNTSHDIGPFHNYVLAGLFNLFGYNVYIPRLYVAILSAATVVVTYWIARHWAGRMTALIAASILATNSMHILVTHMAWSNDTTPFFVGLAVLVTLKTIDQERRSLWALTGLTWAIALQTHPSVIAALLGVIFYLTRHFGWRAFYRESHFRTAIAVFIAGYSNMIVHNILKPFDSFLWVKRKDYALNQEFSIQIYIDNILEMSSELVHSLSSTFPDGKGWLHSISLLIMFLFIIGLIDGFRRLYSFRHGGLLLAIVISSLLVIPILNDQYKFYVWTRYIAYLFPLSLIAVAIGFHSWIRLWAGGGRFRQWNKKRGTVLATAWAIILILPLHHFYNYADSYIQSGRDNSAEFSAVRTLQSKNTAQSIIAVDKQVKQAEAVSKMLRVKGFTSPLVGIDPNEVREVQAIPSNWEEGIDSAFYTRWRKALTENKPDTWYVLSMDTKDKLTALFGIIWADVETIHGESGKLTYFIGQISSFEY